MQHCSRGRALHIADADRNKTLVELSNQSLIIFRILEQYTTLKYKSVVCKYRKKQNKE